MVLNMLLESCCSTRNSLYHYIGPTYKQTKKIALTDPMMLKRYLPDEVCSKKFNESELKQEFVTGSVLQMLGGDDPDSIRGMGPQGVILEEWAMMPYGRIIWEQILEPVLRENGGWAIFIFTPKGHNFAYEYSERAKLNATGEWLYSELPASLSGIISADELKKAQAETPERLFMQEYECAFLEDASSVFHNVDDCIGGQLLERGLPNRRYILGVDLGRTEDFTVLTAIDIGTNQVVGFERFTDTDWAIQKERIVLMAKRFNNAQVILDATGFSAGSVIAEDLKKHPLIEDLKMCQLRVIPFNFNNRNKRALVEKLIVSIEQKLIIYPKIEQLLSELKAFTYSVSEFGNVRYGAPEGLYDDCVISLGLAVWGLGSYVYAPLRTLPPIMESRSGNDYGRHKPMAKKHVPLSSWGN